MVLYLVLLGGAAKGTCQTSIISIEKASLRVTLELVLDSVSHPAHNPLIWGLQSTTGGQKAAVPSTGSMTEDAACNLSLVHGERVMT